MPVIQPINQVAFSSIGNVLGFAGAVSVGSLRGLSQLIPSTGLIQISAVGSRIVRGVGFANDWYTPTAGNALGSWSETGFINNQYMTYSVWMYYTGYNTNWRNIFHIQVSPGADGGRRPSWWIQPSGTKLHIRHDNPTTVNEGISTTSFTPSLNTLYHLVITQNNTVMRVYWNGSFSEQFNFTNTPNNVDSTYFLYSGNTTIYNNSINIQMNKLWVYPRVFTNDQVLALYNTEQSTAYYTATYVLDKLSSASRQTIVGCFALKLLTVAYQGPTVNIIRSTDGVSADFFGNINGELGTSFNAGGTLLLSWLGAAIGYITIWYDQSGWLRHITQPTSANRPRVIMYNSKWEVLFNGSTWLQSLDAAYETQTMSLATQFTPNGTTTDWQPVISKISSGTDRHYGLWLPSTDEYILWQRYGPTGSAGIVSTGFSQSTILNNRLRLVTTTGLTNNKMYLNGSLNAQDSAVYTYYSSSAGYFNIGGHNLFHVLYKGYVHDCFIFNSEIPLLDVTVVST